jgi:hypothetical protein
VTVDDPSTVAIAVFRLSLGVHRLTAVRECAVRILASPRVARPATPEYNEPLSDGGWGRAGSAVTSRMARGEAVALRHAVATVGPEVSL